MRIIRPSQLDPTTTWPAGFEINCSNCSAIFVITPQTTKVEPDALLDKSQYKIVTDISTRPNNPNIQVTTEILHVSCPECGTITVSPKPNPTDSPVSNMDPLEERNLLLLYLSREYNSWLVHDAQRSQAVLVMETPQGQASWRLNRRARVLFKHLELKAATTWTRRTSNENYTLLLGSLSFPDEITEPQPPTSPIFAPVTAPTSTT